MPYTRLVYALFYLNFAVFAQYVSHKTDKNEF